MQNPPAQRNLNGKTLLKLEGLKLAVIGLGYVGLPLAVEFGKGL